MAQASKVEEVFQQNRDLSQRLADLEKLWVEEEKFTTELRGRVEVLQVRLFPGGDIPWLTTNVSRIRFASVACLGVGRFLLR